MFAVKSLLEAGHWSPEQVPLATRLENPESVEIWYLTFSLVEYLPHKEIELLVGLKEETPWAKFAHGD